MLRLISSASPAVLLVVLAAWATPPGPASGAAPASDVAAAMYSIDGNHSNVGFRVLHYGLTFVEGEFDDFEGTIAFDPENIDATDANVTIATASVDTDVERRDAHLRSADFFEAETYSEMTFRSSGARGHDAEAQRFLLDGTLTMKGVSKPVVLDVAYRGPADVGRGGTRAGFHATTTIQRSEWGIDYGLPGTTIADEVEIVLDVEAIAQN